MVKATSDAIPLIAACPDDSGGSFVLWQEESSHYHGTLRLQHMTVTGDPSWPQEVVVRGSSSSRHVIGLIPDDLGGVYTWWVEPSTAHAVPPLLVVLRLEGSRGVPAIGWPASGDTFFVSDTLPYAAPQVVGDGAHGLYATWITPSNTVAAIHLGPDNADAGGWPGGLLTLGPYVKGEELKVWPQIALAGDGGAFLAWGSIGFNGSLKPGHFRLRRVSASGNNVAPWPEEGLDFGRLDPSLLGAPDAYVASNLSLAADGRGGAFLLAVEGDSVCTTRLFRVAPNGSSAEDWPAAGKVVAQGCPAGNPPPQSRIVFSNGVDGAVTSRPEWIPCEGNSNIQTFFDNFSPNGDLPPAEGAVIGSSAAVPFDQGSVLVAYSRTSQSGMLCHWSWLVVTQLSGPSQWQDLVRNEEFGPQYGGIAVAALGPASAVMFWQQSNYNIPTGLLALKFNGSGEVVSAPSLPSPPKAVLDRVRFIHGVGVEATFHLVGGGEGALELLDAQGRRLVGTRVLGNAEVIIPGTERLRSGVYFARLRFPGGDAAARLLVIQ